MNGERGLLLVFSVLTFFGFIFLATITGTGKNGGGGEGYNYCCTNDEVFHIGFYARSETSIVNEIFFVKLGSAHVGAVDRADLHQFAFFNEQRYVDNLASLKCRLLLHVVGGITTHALRRFSDFKNHRRWYLNLSWATFDAKDFDFEILDEILFRVSNEFFVQRDRLIGRGIHEMVAMMVTVAELEWLALNVHHIYLFSRREPDIGRLARSDIPDNALHECTEIAGCAMLNFKNNGWISVVTDGHPFAKIVGCWHK